MSAETAPPFPWTSLESFSATEASAVRRLRRALSSMIPLEALASALAELCSAPVSIFVRRVRRADPRAEQGLDDAIGVLLAPADARSPAERMLVEVEGLLAASFVSRALRARAPRITDPSRAVTPQVAGALAAVLASAARKSGAGGVLRVVAAGPAAALARDLVQSTTHATSAWLTICVAEDAFHARITVPDAAALVPPRPTPEETRAAFLRMGEAQLAIPLVATTCLALRHDVGALATGDAFLPGTFALRASASGDLIGDVSLVPARAERGLAAQLAENGQLVVRGLVESHPLSHEPESPQPMSDTNDTIQVLEEVPVVVRVELGAVEMTAREWTELGPGDIVSLRRKIGDPAVLRIGGAEVARGELVVVDGEYGVRIVSR